MWIHVNNELVNMDRYDAIDSIPTEDGLQSHVCITRRTAGNVGQFDRMVLKRAVSHAAADEFIKDIAYALAKGAPVHIINP